MTTKKPAPAPPRGRNFKFEEDLSSSHAEQRLLKKKRFRRRKV